MVHNSLTTYAKQRPILIGLLTVLAVVGAGVTLAFATGMVTPSETQAQTLPPCCNPPPPPPPPPPADDIECTLNIAASQIPLGSGTSMRWTTDNADRVVIDQGIGAVAPNAGRAIFPTRTTTYTLTATNNEGGRVTCSDTVTVVTQQNVPECTLVATPASVAKGGTVTLQWTTKNATSASINQGIGPVTPVKAGTRTHNPTKDTTYTLTATGPGGTVKCSDSVVIKQPQAKLQCTLAINPNHINRGDSATMVWTTKNAVSARIDKGIGAVSLNGNTSISPKVTTTYVLTATAANGDTVTCTDTITVDVPAQNIACTLDVVPGRIDKGENARLTWTTDHANKVVINQGIGNVALDGNRNVSPNKDTTYTLTATGPAGEVTCTATVRVGKPTTDKKPWCELEIDESSIDEGESARLTWDSRNVRSVRINNGIGSVGESGSRTIRPDEDETYVGTFIGDNGDEIECTDRIRVDEDDRDRDEDPDVDIGVVGTTPEPPLSYVYLSDVPYTGLDLGPFGTAMYWLVLIGGSGALAYFVLFGFVPLMNRKARAFGANVSDALNSGHGPADTHAEHAAHSAAVAAAPRRSYADYATDQGFRSFATEEALTIDDIVHGLSRMPVEAEAPSYAMSEVRSEETREEAPVAVPAARSQVAVSDDVTGFLGALLSGDRDAVFGSLRSVTRGGADSQDFLTQAVCALDDAYRAKLEGGTCHPEIAALTENCHPSFLERLIGSLATAVDSSYSSGVTGVKLAVTRALSVVQG